MFWPYGVVAIAVIVAFAVGYILGEFAGVRAITKAKYWNL